MAASGEGPQARQEHSKMMARSNRKLLTRAIGATVGAVIFVGMTATQGRADDDDLPDTKFLRGVLEAVGLRKKDDGIDYRERSPLVVPPSRNLPPPANAKAAAQNPAWPNDPDLEARRKARAERNKPTGYGDPVLERNRPLRPNEIIRSNAPGTPAGTGSNRSYDPSAPMRPSELGYKGGLWNSLFNPKEEEYTTFTGEAPRASLIEPPAGYRTPSPTQPYGVGKERYQAAPVDRLLPQR